MTKEEMIHLLKADVQEWNRWRRTLVEPGVPRVRIDLSGAKFVGDDLSRANLTEVPLSGAILDHADLSSADLSGADLSDASLVEAGLVDTSFVNTNLTRADLRGAKLVSARLSWTTLHRADLTAATLTGAIFTRSWLDEANFTDAFCGGTVFGDVDLSTVRGLDTVEHRGPSTVGFDTIYRSQGKIPESFLRDAGMPEELIHYVPSLIGAQEGIRFHSCFISFSFKDVEFAHRLHSRMRDAKLLVWFAPEDGQGGKKLHEQIETQIQVQDKLLLVLSQASIQSPWVAHEIYTARQREIREKRQVLFPIALCSFEDIRKWNCFDADSGKDMAREIREYLIPDFSTWKDHNKFEAEFKKLLRDLQSDVPPPAPAV